MRMTYHCGLSLERTLCSDKFFFSDNWNSLLINIDVNDEPRYRKEGVQGPNLGWNYPDGLFVGNFMGTILMVCCLSRGLRALT
jgi:hypothetical protein